ncbi:aldose 1-epimerase [Pseudomonas sp. RHF3.3-3]|uniref:aldose epimerase family protein n=1 Tax=Pseudomonas sp. RHF3.3-3 TaxID=3396624 RepID=UPI003A876322
MKRIELANATWSLALLPEWGGRVALLQADGLDIMTPIRAEAFDPLAWPRGGIYPLLPYSNRLRDARLEHAGASHVLPAHPAALPHTLHGVAQTLPWQVVEQGTGHVDLACEYTGEHWPWPVRFEQRFSLEGQRLRIDLGLTNLGHSSMPGGLGLHPYFQRHPGMRIELSVGRSWDIDAAYLPTGRSRSLEQPLVIDDSPQQELALYGSQWDGALRVDYPQGRLLMQAQAPLTHFVAFAPMDAAYLCLEPVSHLADAFNSPVAEWPAQGTQVLEPGQRLGSTLVFNWQAR